MELAEEAGEARGAVGGGGAVVEGGGEGFGGEDGVGRRNGLRMSGLWDGFGHRDAFGVSAAAPEGEEEGFSLR